MTEDFRSIILMCIGLVTLKRWTRLVFEDYVYGDGVSLIEWANLIDEILPANRTEITIEKDLEQGFDFRRITVEKRGE